MSFIFQKAYDPIRDEGMLWRTPDPSPQKNPQTESLCYKLRIDDPLVLLRGFENRTGLARSSHQENVTRSCRREAMAVSVDAESGKNEKNRSSNTATDENVTNPPKNEYNK